MSELTLTVDGVEYGPVERTDQENRVIVRSRDSGVHYGTLAARDGAEVRLTNSRRIWYWSGAASLSELATHGVTHPADCKFTVRVPEITVLGVCEVIPCTPKACDIIEEVPEWRQS